ncbi:hypothetical protein DPEC_G00099860 [Dallia pectoralis]|uniref:Uncharacterized protein n=1 Tax=Dallia pectoralis TaxID=75939 RepID=A0ACC2GW65_DALPE|nr:hypothetical protein DPEC_G00099860 [Dallia pectoralis]
MHLLRSESVATHVVDDVSGRSRVVGSWVGENSRRIEKQPDRTLPNPSIIRFQPPPPLERMHTQPHLSAGPTPLSGAARRSNGGLFRQLYYCHHHSATRSRAATDGVTPVAPRRRWSRARAAAPGVGPRRR